MGDKSRITLEQIETRQRFNEIEGALLAVTHTHHDVNHPKRGLHYKTPSPTHVGEGPKSGLTSQTTSTVTSAFGSFHTAVLLAGIHKWSGVENAK